GFSRLVRAIDNSIRVIRFTPEKEITKSAGWIEVTAGGADSLGCNQHARTNDYSFVNRIAEGNIDKLAAAHESAPEIAYGSETCFDSGARVRRGNDRLL